MPQIPKHQYLQQVFSKGMLDKFPKNPFTALSKNDPVENCSLYKDKGCTHVDGMLCDFPNCSMNNEYLKQKKV